MQYNYSNCCYTVISTIKELGVRITESTLVTEIQKHPDYPSFLSIHEVLRTFGITSYPIDVDKAAIDQLPIPFIAHLDSKTGQFATVSKIEKEFVTYYANEKSLKRSTISKEKFIDIWSGKTILLEKKGAQTEDNFIQKRIIQTVENNRLLISLMFIILCILIWMWVNYSSYSLVEFSSLSIQLLLSVSGAIVSTLLLWMESDRGSNSLANFCESRDKRFSCRTVTDSTYSKFLGFIRWSEIGFIYFTGISLLVFWGKNSIVFPLLLLNAIASLYIPFSLSYQAFIIKKWCKLCLLILSTLLLQVFSTIYYISTTSFLKIYSKFPFDSIPLLIVAFGIPVIFLLILKPLLSEYNTRIKKSFELDRIKSNFAIFKFLSAPKKVKVTAPSLDYSLSLGNSLGEISMIVVSNPYCTPCARAHQLLEEAIEFNPNIHMQIVFTATNSSYDKQSLPVKHLLNIKNETGNEKAAIALSAWYKDAFKDFDSWSTKYSVEKATISDSLIASMANWCVISGISHTPTIFINGYPIPSLYNIEDVSRMVKYMHNI